MHKAISVKAKDNYNLKVEFEDGKVVLYDIKPLFSVIPAFRTLQEDSKLYRSVRVAPDGDMIIWDENLNLDAKNIWANGNLVEFTKKTKVNHLLAYRIQLSRFFAGMTQKELAEKTGIYQADISKLERGIGNPSVNTLERIAEGLGMDLYIDFRYPAVMGTGNQETEEKKMGRLAERRSGVFMVKPEMTEAFIQHMIENKKPDNYWEECMKSRDLPKEVVDEIMRLAREDEN